MPNITKAEFETLKSSIAQAERSRNALAERVANAEKVINRLIEGDREDAEVLAQTVEEICGILGWENPLRRDFSELRDEWQATYESVDAAYYALSDLRSRIEDNLYALDEYSEGSYDYESDDIESEFESIEDEYYDSLRFSRDHY